ncbi:hypothetical protein ACWFRM_14470 [Streptomyces sp. NPDC055144]
MATARLATPADAGEITRLRSELLLSQPLDEGRFAICTDNLASRPAPDGDALAYVLHALSAVL